MVCFDDDILSVGILLNLAYNVLNLVRFALIIEKIGNVAHLFQHLFIELHMAVIVYNVFTFINQEATLVDRSKILICQLTVLIL